jgi:hypothetical protein
LDITLYSRLPYSIALNNLQKRKSLAEEIDDQRLPWKQAKHSIPQKNPYISTSFLRLLNIGGQNPPLNLAVQGKLSDWQNNYNELYDLQE